MEIQFLGTGAADYPWENGKNRDLRGSASTLLNGSVLIDAGTTALWNLQRAGIDCSAVTDLLITHSHSDHFQPDQIAAIGASPRSVPLRVYASPEALEKLSGNFQKIPLHWGDTLEIASMQVLVTPSNHLVECMAEETFHFLIQSGGKNLYYALDGGWFTARERALLGKTVLDLIVWDATCGNTFDDWRFAEHNDLNMIRSMIRSLLGAGLIRKDTRHIFDHVALTLWPQDEEAKRSLAEEYGGILAADGMEHTL